MEVTVVGTNAKSSSDRPGNIDWDGKDLASGRLMRADGWLGQESLVRSSLPRLGGQLQSDVRSLFATSDRTLDLDIERSASHVFELDSSVGGLLCCSCASCQGQSELSFGRADSTDIFAGTIAESQLADDRIQALVYGSTWSGSKVTYSFYEDDVFKGAYYGSQPGVGEVSEAVKDNVRVIFDWLETIIDLDFEEVAETNTSTFGQIRVMLSDDPGYAYAYYPSTFSQLGGDIHLKTSYDYSGNTNGFQNTAGKHGYGIRCHYSQRCCRECSSYRS